MKAVVQDRYGPAEVLHVADVPAPIPRDDEVLIRVRAASVSQTDTHLRKPDPFVWRFIAGFRRPRWPSLGVELSGIVEAVGTAVTEFNVGDEVFGQPAFMGAHVELICIRANALLAHKPDELPFDEAAAACDGANQALATLRVADVQPGQRILVYGASGSLGSAAVQLAKNLGAQVTGVCGTAHVDLVRSLGADEVIDYRRDDFTNAGEVYDAIIDAVGKGSFPNARRALKPGGVYVATDGVRNFFWALWTWRVGKKRLKFAAGRRSRKDLLFLKELIEAGEYRPVVDRSYPMEQVVEAHRYVEAWHKAGNVVLTIGVGPES